MEYNYIDNSFFLPKQVNKTQHIRKAKVQKQC